MARLTVEEIMQSIAATVNQESDAPDSGGAEFNLWLKFINRSYFEWAESNDWEELREHFYPAVTGTSQATLTLPLNFRKMAAAPRLYVVSGLAEGEEFPDIPEEEKGLYTTTDKYVYQLGNFQDGHSLIFHPATLSSGASIQIQYYSTPTSLASPSEVPKTSYSHFLIDSTISYILEARSDPRFQQQEAKAREKLMQMVEAANLAKYNSYGNPQYVQAAPLRKMGFRIGRD